MAAPFRKRAQAPVYDDKRDGFGYSALFDRHLQEFYASPARRRQLREARVLTKHGVVVDDQTFKRREEKVERKQREAQKRHESMRRDAAAQAERLRKEKQDRREKKLLLHIAKERATKAKDKRLEPGSPKVAMHQTFGRTATSQRHSAGSPGFRDLKAETTTKRREASGPVGRRVVSSSTTPIQGGGRHVVSRSRPRPLTSSSRDRAHYSTTSQASSKRDSEAVPRATKLPVSGTLRTARYRSPGRARPASAAAYATT